MSQGSGRIAPGTIIDGRYAVVSAIGGGGYGMVYRARQVNMDREVAVKVIHPHLAHDERLVKRFLREARAVTRLKNPHIVQVFDAGHEPDGPLYIVMELIEGRTLKAVFAEEGALPPARLCKLLAQVCEALAEAHSFRAPGSERDTPIVHRDLKPENILVSRTRTGSEHCYLVDFGIVRMEEDSGEVDLSLTGGLAIGTPHYMSPEQAFGDKPTLKADLWALGVILYQGLSGRLPFTGPSAHAIVASVTRDPPKPLEPAAGQPPLPPDLAALTLALLQRDPLARPENAQAVQATLLSYAMTSSPHPALTPHPGLTPQPGLPAVSQTARSRAAGAVPTAVPHLALGQEDDGSAATLRLVSAPRPPAASRVWLPLAIGAGLALVAALWWTNRSMPAAASVSLATTAAESSPPPAPHAVTAGPAPAAAARAEESVPALAAPPAGATAPGDLAGAAAHEQLAPPRPEATPAPAAAPIAAAPSTPIAAAPSAPTPAPAAKTKAQKQPGVRTAPKLRLD